MEGNVSAVWIVITFYVDIHDAQIYEDFGDSLSSSTTMRTTFLFEFQ